MPWPARRHTLPDGRQLEAVYDPHQHASWTVRLLGRDDWSASGHDIHAALLELLHPRGHWPSWFIAAADDLAARDTPLGRRYGCPCCGYLTLHRTPSGTYDVCDVCFWEDDGVQLQHPDMAGGANTTSLLQARETFAEHGVSDLRFRRNVRPPLRDEYP